MDPRRAVLQPAGDRARQHDPQRRHPHDRARPRRHEQPAAVDGRLLHAGVRRPAAHRRQPRRPLRPARRAAARPRDLRPRLAGVGVRRHRRTSSSRTRAFMGIGGAFIMPATLSIITNVFPPHERGKAIGVWAGTAGLGGALGPLTGGFLLEHFYWGSVFLVNIPIVIVGLLAGRLPHPDVEGPARAAARPGRRGAVDRRAHRAALRDHRGAAGRLDRPDDPRRASSSALVLLGAFVAVGAHTDHPMLDVHVLQEPAVHRREPRRSRWCSSPCSASMFLLTQYFQFVLGYTPFETGVRFLPVALCDDGRRAARARGSCDRIGTKLVVAHRAAAWSPPASCRWASLQRRQPRTGPTSSGG